MWSQNGMLFTALTPCVGVLEDDQIHLLHWFLWKRFENGAMFTLQMYLLHYNDRIQKAYQSRKANECPELICNIDSSHYIWQTQKRFVSVTILWKWDRSHTTLVMKWLQYGPISIVIYSQTHLVSYIYTMDIGPYWTFFITKVILERSYFHSNI